MARLRVEVVYAQAGTEDRVSLDLVAGSRAIDAVGLSGLADRHPEIGQGELLLGIFGARVPPDAILVDGDRVEVYRPLKNDPKALRRSRASAGRRTRA